jgi:hypothetical protein
MNTKKPKRSGAEEALGENVYIYNDPKAGDVYAKTTEAIANYIQTKYDRIGAKVADTIRNMKRIDLDTSKPKPEGQTVKKDDVMMFVMDDIQKLEYSQLL